MKRTKNKQEAKGSDALPEGVSAIKYTDEITLDKMIAREGEAAELTEGLLGDEVQEYRSLAQKGVL